MRISRSIVLVRAGALQVSILILIAPSILAGAKNDAPRTLEPITVTAQKSPELLYEVPIAVSVVSGEKITDLTMRQLQDLSFYVPNLNISQDASISRLFIRGVGSGLNLGFEQSVGIFVDGIYTGRDRQTRIPFFDIERVEILKGPQGILFGKNTTAGAVNIVTAKPADTPESYLSTFYAPDHGEAFAQGAVSGPLAGGLSARIAGRISGLDGYLENTALNRRNPEKQEQSVRGSLHWGGAKDLSIGAKYEYGHFEIRGRTSQIVETGRFGPVFSALDPAFESKFDTRRSAGHNSPLFGPDISDTTYQNTAVFISSRIGDHALSATTGYSAFRYDDLYDFDLSAFSVFGFDLEEEFRQLSQEIRLDSPKATTASWQPWNREALEYLFGVYYQYQDLQIDTILNLDTRELNALGLGIPGFALSRVNRSEQQSHSWSAFGQVNWHPVEDWRLTAGLRFTHESKTAAKNLFIASLGGRTANPALNPVGAMITVLPHRFDKSRDESHLMPMAGVQWDISDDHQAYFSFTTSAKGGGFDDNATSGVLADYEFDEEFAYSYEIGANTRWLGDSLSLNIALFRTNFDNFQVSQFDSRTSFVVGNAASVTSQGIELDGRWQVFEDLRLTASLALLDARYSSFPDAACTAVQNLRFQASGAPGGCTQDLSGSPTPYAPNWSGNFYLDHVFPLHRLDLAAVYLNDLAVRTQINLNFSDGYFLAEDLDPLLQQGAYVTLDARFALGDLARHWELAFVGKNLTNELIGLDGNDIPLLQGALRQATARPRSVGVQLVLAY